jgi:DNA-binding response OmpR family regulator
LRQEKASKLEQAGFRVKAVETANELYRYLAVRPTTIAVLEIDLPGEDGIRIKITANESLTLRTLLKKNGDVCSHAELGMAIDQHPDELNKHLLEVILSRLSSKVKRISGLTLPIQSFRGIGYGLLIQHG